MQVFLFKQIFYILEWATELLMIAEVHEKAVKTYDSISNWHSIANWPKDIRSFISSNNSNFLDWFISNLKSGN